MTDPTDPGPLTLGYSPCPNDTFIFEALAHRRLDPATFPEVAIELADVEALNRRAVAGDIDVTKYEGLWGQHVDR